MRAPFSSRIALVAMVVPCTKRSMSSGASPLSASTASTPARTPATRSSGDEGTFAAQTRSPPPAEHVGEGASDVDPDPESVVRSGHIHLQITLAARPVRTLGAIR